MSDFTVGGYSAGSSYEQIKLSAELDMRHPPPAFADLVRGGGGAAALLDFEPGTGDGSLSTLHFFSTC